MRPQVLRSCCGGTGLATSLRGETPVMSVFPVAHFHQDRSAGGKDSTLADVGGGAAARRGQPWRTAAISILCAVVLLGALGALGVRSHSVAAAGGGFQLSLTYP